MIRLVHGSRGEHVQMEAISVPTDNPAVAELLARRYAELVLRWDEVTSVTVPARGVLGFPAKVLHDRETLIAMQTAWDEAEDRS